MVEMYTHKKKSQCYIIVSVCVCVCVCVYNFHSFNKDRSKRYWCSKKIRICNAQCNSQDLDEISATQDETGNQQNINV